MRFLFVLVAFFLLAGSCGAQQVYYVTPVPVYYAAPAYYVPAPAYQHPIRYESGWNRIPNYDYGTHRFVSPGERAWLDQRAFDAITGGPGSPLFMKGIRLWVRLGGG